MRHMTSKIWQITNMSILVSKAASGPQESSPVICFCLKNCFQLQQIKYPLKIFFLYNLWKCLAKMEMKSGHIRNHLSGILLVFWGFSDLIQWRNTWAIIANPIWQFFGHPNLRLMCYLQQNNKVQATLELRKKKINK